MTDSIVNEGRRALSASARRAEIEAETYISLRADMIEALMTDPATIVHADVKRSPVYEVIYDAFAGKNGDAMLCELLKICGMAAAGKVDHELHLRASAWIAQRAADYAAWYAPDLAAQEE